MIDIDKKTTSLMLPDDGTGRARVDLGWTEDGKRIRFALTAGEGRAFIERDVASGAETETFRVPAACTGAFARSPDGRFLVCVARDTTAGRSLSLLSMPVEGGQPTTLLAASEGEALSAVWTPDSRAILARKTVRKTGHAEMWLARLGSAPRRLDIDTSKWEGRFALHPDGRQLAFVATVGEPGAEVWALENFLPVQSSRRQ